MEVIEDGDIHNAVISFVAEDKKHGYVVLVQRREDLSKDYIYDRNKPSYKFHPVKGTEPEKWQIVEVQVSHKKQFKLATITRNTYAGLKDDKEVVRPVGEFLRSLDQLVTRKPEPEFLALEKNAPVDYFLYYDEVRHHLVAREPAPVENEKSFYEELKSDFTYHTNQVTSKGIIKAGEIAPLLLKDDREKLLVQFQLKFLIGKLEEKQNPILSRLFLTTFGKTIPELLNSESCLRVMGGDSVKLVQLWLKEELSEKLLDPKTIQKWHAEQDLFGKLKLEEFCSFFFKIRNFPNYTYLLESGLNALEKIPEKYLKELTRLVNFSINQDALNEILFKRLSFESLMSLWRANEIQEIPGHLWKENFETLEEKDKLKLLNLINWETFINYSGTNCESSSAIIKDYLDYFEVLIGEKINYCSFDLEVSPTSGKINELAYKTRSHEEELLDPEPDEILDLKNLIEKSDLIIGHNIKRFDLQKLYGENTPELKIWDTLQVETLLNPSAGSLALKTAHEALKDVQHCLKLFKYQVYRIIRSVELKELLIEAGIVSWIPSSDLPLLNIIEEELEENHKDIFHPSGSKINKIFKGLIPYNASLIVCPEAFWGHFRDEPKIGFAEKEHHYQLVLHPQSMEEKLKDHPFLRCSLRSYLNQCVKNQFHPYLRRISPYLVQEVEKLFPIVQISFKPKINQDLTIASEWYFAQNREDLLKTRKAEHIYMFGTDVWKYISKRKFAALDREDLYKTDDGNSLWVKFSNGRSHTEIDQEYAKALDQKIQGKNFWIEKEAAEHYSLWGGNSEIPNGFEIIKLGEHLAEAKPKDYNPVRYITYTSNTKAKITDLNPETLYRNIYWDAKLKTLVHLLNMQKVKNKCVLLISNKEEIEQITSILKKAGRYSPSINAPLRRRLELLTESERGILVAPVESFDQLLSFPQVEGVAYVMESLCPEELLVISGTRRENKVQDVKDSMDDDETETEGTELPHFSSIGMSINKLNSYYNYLFGKVLLQNKDNELVILDPRAGKKLFSDYSCKPLTVDFKKIQESQVKEYQIITDQVKSLIYSPREFKYDDIKEHLDRIASIFLKGKGGEFNAAQNDFLEYIFPGMEDVLVTLPTGVGKSVLFQGPSLYRSSYTGRLSIVVTPLKALMEDHVMGLWKLGFWNAVDFINSDKGSEVNDIYRKISGGELLMVFVTPERFRSRGFIKAMEERMQIDGRLEYLIFDEAHCISQWGSEFRPDYFYCSQRVKEIRRDRNFPLLLLSATVTRQVAENIENALYEKV